MAQIDTLTNVGAVVSTDLALILRGGANVLGTFGSLVGQNATAVTITGGTVNGTVIGGVTAAAGSFTTGAFSSTLGVTGVSTLAAMTATTGTFSGAITSTLSAGGQGYVYLGNSSHGLQRNGSAATGDVNDVELYTVGGAGGIVLSTGGLGSAQFRMDTSGLVSLTGGITATTGTFSGLTTVSSLTTTGSGTNTVHLTGAGSQDLYTYSDGGGIGWATGAAGAYGEMVYLSDITNDIAFYTGGSLRGKFNSTGLDVTGAATFSGNITTTSTDLSIDSANYARFLLDRGTTGYESAMRLATAGSTDWFLGMGASGGTNGDLEFYSYGTASVVLNVAKATGAATFSGAVGVGVTPSAWTYFSPIQAGRSSFVGSDGQTGVGYNWYFDGAYKYIANDYALAYQQNAASGVHSWSTAASGTAGAAVSWNPAMTLDASGNLLVGGTSVGAADSCAIEEYGGITVSRASGTGRTMLAFKNGGTAVGTISTNASSTTYATSSDYRLKEDDVPMTGVTERVKALRPINFAWKVDGSRTDGFFAHEAQEVVPECATGTKDAMRDEEYEVTPAVEEVRDEDGNVTTEAVAAVMGTRSVPDYQGIDQSKLVPLLTATIQELIARIEALEGA